MVSQYRKAVAAVVGVVALLLAQLFGLNLDESVQGAVVNVVLAVGTVVAVFQARNHPSPRPARLVERDRF